MRNLAINAKDPSQELTLDQRQKIDSECIGLVYDRTFFGIVASVISAAATALLLWPLIDTQLIVMWLVAMVVMIAGRLILVNQFRNQERTIKETLVWGRWNTIAVGLTGILWAMVMVALFPDTSVPHQFCMAMILSGMTAGAAALYGYVHITFFAFLAPIIVSVIIRFAFYPDILHLMIAGVAAFYGIMMTLTARSIRQTRRELLMAKYNLMDLVRAGLHEVEKTNEQLEAEIQERKEIEENLRQERDRLEMITRTIGAGLAVISIDYRIIWANRVFTEMFGEVEGKRCYHTQYQQDRMCDDCGARMIFDLGYKSITHEQKGIDTQGNTIWSQIITTPILDHSGQTTAALELVLPITERKLAQEKQKQLATQLEQARKTEAIATLAGGIAHQFNNALAIIVGNTELLDHDFTAQIDLSSYVQPILSSAQRMSRLTDQLLAYAHGGKYRPRMADILEVSQTTLDLLRHTIPDRVDIQTNWGYPPKVKVDVTQMQMVLSAIISNAVEAMSPQGCIHIRCDEIIIHSVDRGRYGNIKPGTCAEIIISDNGFGMDTGTLDRVFEPFFTTKFQGRGLGMAAVYGIINNHGGHISVISRPHKGTQVYIYLPGFTETNMVEESGTEDEAAEKKTILLVEDDTTVLSLNQKQLERSGFHVIPAENGQTAADIISGNHLPVDLILLDLKLPDMDGRAILPVIRRHRPSTKILICSGYYPGDDVANLRDAGVNGFIQKPFTLDALLSKIGQVLCAQ